MKMIPFAGRCAKDILRDPLNLAFGLGFPAIILLLLSAIQANVPAALFEIRHLAPGIAVFGLSFLTLFSSALIARDRESALLQRLYTTPLTATDFILGYTLPLIPISAAQSAICYLLSVFLGLPVTIHILYAVLWNVPAAVFQIALGLLCGSIFSSKQVGGICGALLTNVSAWLSGTWFDLELVGGAFQKIASFLPFSHAVELERAVINGNFAGILPHLSYVLGFALLAMTGAAALFLRQIRNQ